MVKGPGTRWCDACQPERGSHSVGAVGVTSEAEAQSQSGRKHPVLQVGSWRPGEGVGLCVLYPLGQVLDRYAL